MTKRADKRLMVNLMLRRFCHGVKLWDENDPQEYIVCVDPVMCCLQ